VLREWLGTRSTCWCAARHRLGKIERRIELLDGYLIAYLNSTR
jgi:hypothetical protein